MMKPKSHALWLELRVEGTVITNLRLAVLTAVLGRAFRWCTALMAASSWCQRSCQWLELEAISPRDANALARAKMVEYRLKAVKVSARDQHYAAMAVMLVLSAYRSLTIKSPGTRKKKNTGCRSICMSVARSTRCCICSTRASGIKCSIN